MFSFGHCPNYLSPVHQFFISCSSVLDQLFISSWSAVHQFFISSVTSFAPKAQRPTFSARLSMPDYPSYIFSISFVFLNRLLFCVISTVQWSGASSICDGIISYTAMLIITKLYWLYPDHLLTLTKDNHCVPGCKIELWRDKYLCQLTSLFSVLGWLKGQLKQRYGQLAQVNGTIGHRRRRS